MAGILPVTEKDVCIIGAGMTGLCACKHLMQHGFKPTVLEARDCVGGIWRHTCSITKLQSSRDGYQFSDFIWPEGTPPNPHNEQVVDYLESYATHFHLKERIIFNCKVIEIKSRLGGDAHVTGLWGGNGSAFAGDDNGGKVWQVLVQRQKSKLHDDDEVEEEVSLLFFTFTMFCAIVTHICYMGIALVNPPLHHHVPADRVRFRSGYISISWSFAWVVLEIAQSSLYFLLVKDLKYSQARCSMPCSMGC